MAWLSRLRNRLTQFRWLNSTWTRTHARLLRMSKGRLRFGFMLGGKPTVHPVALDMRDVPWAEKQMWAPDAARKNGRYFLYFPAKDKEGVFRIGVATSDRPEGPFKAEQYRY